MWLSFYSNNYCPGRYGISSTDQNQQGGSGGGILAAIESDTSSESDSEVYMDGCGSPRMQRRRRHKTFRAEKVNRSITFRTLDELMYDDNLPETNRLVEVTSNIWATKFQMTGVSSSLPSCLGQVVYKTSLLRLQPRQMTVSIAEVSPSRHTLSRDPNFSPAPVSDDEDSSLCTSDGDLAAERKTVEVTVHDANVNLMADVGHIPRDGIGLEYSRRCSAVDSPLIENSSMAVNGVDIAMTTAVPVACVGGVAVVAGKLGGSGTVRSRSLSPVRNSLTQSVPAFKQDGVGAADGMAGDVLLSSTNNGGGGWQGARPKANNYTTSSSSNIILSPVLSSRDSTGPGSVGSKRTGNNVVNTTCAGSKVSCNTNCSNISSVNDSHVYQVTTTTSSPKSGNNVSARSNTSNSKCSKPSSSPSTQPASSQYAISPCSPSHSTTVGGSSHLETFPSASLPGNISPVTIKQESSILEVKQGKTCSSRSDRTCFKGGLDLVSVGVTPAAQIGEFYPSCSPNIQHHDTSRQLSRWADPAAEAVHLLLEDTATSVSGQNQREECGHKSPQSQHPLSLQSTPVADCSPTAPYNSDIHRRLYLAQHSFLPDSGAPISPSGCPSCLPPNLCYRDDMSPVQCTDFHNARFPGLFNGTKATSQLPDSVRQNNLKNSSPPLPCHLSGKPSHPCIGNSWSKSSSQQHHTASNTSSALSVTEDVSVKKLQEQQSPLRSKQTALPDNSEHLASAAAASSTFISSTSACLLSVLSGPYCVSSHHVKDPEASPISDQKVGCWFSQSDPPDQTGTRQADGTTPPSTPTGTPEKSSSLDKLALILSEEPSAQLSSHNFRSMPGFVMRNPDLPAINSSSTIDSDASHHHQMDYDGVDADYNSFMSPPPSPPPILHANNHLGSELDIQIQATSASLPSSPIRFGRRNQLAGDPSAAHEDVLKGRCKHLSPLLGRKGLPSQHSRSSSQCQSQDLLGLEELRLGQHYESLEMFQKAQLRQKMRRRINSANGRMEQARMFTMHNKAPLWNETSQVYQLDFGGRVTQESAKNFQIELKGKQVMQFGRIDNHAYTLDFQYPFTAVQAFAVALANVTQRLK
ncbi:tubby-related protein 4 [Elysia marginata]|uniref:Tubby-related protein 4 n=1 Tax=Elysia marginata TaxID=1093978 RepID=A0AAV4EKW2_9GAST|nr:tubby-related protein 4 [Elysia marginata]